jgi:HK97 gp10 family phage protein
MQAAPVRAGLKAVGKYLAEGMATRAPRDMDVEGVTLAEEIVFQAKVSNARDTAAVQIGPSKRAFYGGFQEFGTEKHKPQPFMRPTLDQDGQGAIAVFASHMKAGIERAAKRLAKRAAT